MVWLLEFSQIDLGKTSDGDRAKLVVEISQLAGTWFGSEKPVLVDGRQALEYSQQFPIRDGAGNMIYISNFDLRPAQTCLRDFLNPLLAGIERLRGKIDAKQTEDQPQLAPMLQSFEISKMSVNLRANIPFTLEETLESTDGTVTATYEYAPLGEITIAAAFQTDSMEDALRFRVARILEGVPIDVFHECPECSRWFAHFSERKKQFCSNKCAARYGVRKSRAELKNENPEKYEEDLRAGATRARKSYERTVESGKPARRPYKHK